MTIEIQREAIRTRSATLAEFVSVSAGPVAMSLALVGFTTLALWYIDKWPGTNNLVFIYLVPTTFVALRYGNTAAMFATIMSCILATYFIQEPTLSFTVAKPLDVMELMFFGLLAMLASRVVAGFASDQNVARRRYPTRPRSASMRLTGIIALFNRLRSAG